MAAVTITPEAARQVVSGAFQNLAAILGRNDVSITILMNREDTREAAVKFAVDLAISTISRCGDELGKVNEMMSEYKR